MPIAGIYTRRELLLLDALRPDVELPPWRIAEPVPEALRDLITRSNPIRLVLSLAAVAPYPYRKKALRRYWQQLHDEYLRELAFNGPITGIVTVAVFEDDVLDALLAGEVRLCKHPDCFNLSPPRTGKRGRPREYCSPECARDADNLAHPGHERDSAHRKALALAETDDYLAEKARMYVGQTDAYGQPPRLRKETARLIVEALRGKVLKGTGAPFGVTSVIPASYGLEPDHRLRIFAAIALSPDTAHRDDVTKTRVQAGY
jgi:hypothetical protein